jgi:hypothetical protein
VHGEFLNQEHFLDFARWHDGAMRDLVVLFVHLLVTVARFAGAGGARAVVADPCWSSTRLDGPVDRGGIDAVAIVEDEPMGRLESDDLAKLLDRPLRRGMLRHVPVGESQQGVSRDSQELLRKRASRVAFRPSERC